MIKKADWKTLDAPERRRKIQISRILNDSDADKLVQGHKPRDMDDKWFVYSHNGWVFFHRSWTGYLIFWIKLDGCPAGVRIADGYVNDDQEQYRSPGEEGDIKIINSIIDLCINSP